MLNPFITGNLVRSMFPKLYDAGILPKGNPSQNSKVLFDYNPEKGKKVLGLKYRNVAQIIGDTVADFEARGWLEERQGIV